MSKFRRIAGLVLCLVVVTMAVDGTLWAWGHNTFGQLGDWTRDIHYRG